jgi:hypothetical protein
MSRPAAHLDRPIILVSYGCDRHHDAGSETRGPDETPAISNSELAVIDEVDCEACNPPKASDVEDSPDESQDATPLPGR